MAPAQGIKVFTAICSIVFFAYCSRHAGVKLPLLGEPLVNRATGDTIYPVIRPFSFLSQDSTLVSNATFSNKVYVADFIFLSCPSICPKMNASMLQAYKFFNNDTTVLFLSHTIDPERDNIARLKMHANSLGVSSKKWLFVMGNKDSIYSIAEKNYFATAYKDSTAPGGFAHSGGLLLVDKQRHIRGVYDGTEPSETTRLINDIQILLKE